MEITRNNIANTQDKNMTLSSNENLRFIFDNDRNENFLINSKRWKAKTRVMLACTILALLLFGFAAYLINSYLRKNGEYENANLISSEIDEFISFNSCGNISNTRGCTSGSLCLSRIKRLIGGSESSSISWPWMAELIYQNEHYCGAVLISLNVVLTAAHCLFHDGNRLFPNDLEIRIGSKYRLSQGKNTQSASISQIFIHNSFKLSSLENDIAIITLVRHVTPTNSIWPICITGHKVIKQGTNAKMAGWGKTSYEGSFSSVLKEANVPVVEITKCKIANEGLFQGVSVNKDNNICVGYGKFRPEYGCNGDSGGPLMVETNDRRWKLIGIMSWGGPTCSAKDTNSYTVFTKINTYKKWIKYIFNKVGA